MSWPAEKIDASSDTLLFKLLQEIRDVISMAPEYDEATNAKRVTGSVSAAISSGTVTTVSTVTNQTNIGGLSADQITENSSYAAWLCNRQLYV